MSRVKTSAKDYKLFVSEVRKTIKKWGLSDWRVEIEHHNIDARGSCTHDIKHKVALIRFSTDWGQEPISDSDYPTREKIIETARHECAHLLTAILYEMAFDRHATKDQIVSSNEHLVRKLEGLLP